MALGGKATTTGRGNGLKAFIREGQRSAAQSGVQVAVPSDKPSLPFSVAEVTVTIKNQGDEAYKHNDYGDSIVITRKFTKEGSSGYKIKSKEGKVLSTKREDLSAICDHMNIQIDNPMTILTQGKVFFLQYRFKY